MPASTLTFYGGDIADPSQATPGLFNLRFSRISQNVDELNTSVLDPSEIVGTSNQVSVTTSASRITVGLPSQLTVPGSLQVTSGFTASSAASLLGAVSVAGAARFASTVSVASAFSAVGGASVGAWLDAQSRMSVGSGLSALDTLSAAGAVRFASTASVASAFSAAGDASVGARFDAQSGMSVGSGLSALGALSVAGAVRMASTASVASAFSAAGGASVGAWLDAQSGVSVGSGLSAQAVTATEVATNDGTGVAPASTWTSERSLGWYRSGSSTIRASYGTVYVETFYANAPSQINTLTVANNVTGVKQFISGTQGNVGYYKFGVAEGPGLTADGSNSLFLESGNPVATRIIVGSTGTVTIGPAPTAIAGESDGFHVGGTSTINSVFSGFVWAKHRFYMGPLTGSGAATSPQLGPASELSLGLYRSATSTLAMSYGSMVFRGGNVVLADSLGTYWRVSIRTDGALLSTNVGAL